MGRETEDSGNNYYCFVCFKISWPTGYEFAGKFFKKVSRKWYPEKTGTGPGSELLINRDVPAPCRICVCSTRLQAAGGRPDFLRLISTLVILEGGGMIVRYLIQVIPWDARRRIYNESAEAR